jgi:hypothetical protein
MNQQVVHAGRGVGRNEEHDGQVLFAVFEKNASGEEWMEEVMQKGK